MFRTMYLINPSGQTHFRYPSGREFSVFAANQPRPKNRGHPTLFVDFASPPLAHVAMNDRHRGFVTDRVGLISGYQPHTLSPIYNVVEKHNPFIQ